MLGNNAADLENSVVELMKEYGVENSASRRQQYMAIAEAQGVEGLTDVLEAAKKVGTLGRESIDTEAIMKVSGGAYEAIEAARWEGWFNTAIVGGQCRRVIDTIVGTTELLEPELTPQNVINVNHVDVIT